MLIGWVDRARVLPSLDADHTAVGVVGVPSEVRVAVPVVHVVDGVGSLLPIREGFVPVWKLG